MEFADSDSTELARVSDGTVLFESLGTTLGREGMLTTWVAAGGRLALVESVRDEAAVALPTGIEGCLKGCGARGGLFGGSRWMAIPVALAKTGFELEMLDVDATEEALEEMDVLHDEVADTMLELYDVLLVFVDRSKSICQSSSSSSNSKSGVSSSVRTIGKCTSMHYLPYADAGSLGATAAGLPGTVRVVLLAV